MVEASRPVPEEEWVQQMAKAVQDALAGGLPLQNAQPVARLRPREARTRQECLRRLMRAGLVQEGIRPGEPLVVDRKALAELVEELRLVSEQDVGDPSTTCSSLAPAGSWLNGPKLIAVNGTTEGAIFALEGPRGSWVVGRGQGAEVTLLDDPYVSRQGAEIWQEGDDFFIEDLQPSKNGTYVNWRRLDRREAAHLQDGDIIRVGRSLLVFRSA